MMFRLNLTVLLLACVALSPAGASSAQPHGVGAILARFKPALADKSEDPEARRARLALVAEAVDLATPHRWERMLLVSVAWHESRYASAVQDCTIKGDNGRAVGLWQSWNMKCSDSLQAWADEAIRHLRSAWRYCRAKTLPQKVEMGVSLYATGRTCHHPVAKPRLQLWRRLMRGAL